MILVTGGAGFIGAGVARELIERGHRVRALDSLVGQVHEGRGRPEYLDPDVELIEGDVRDPDAVARALEGVDGVVHLAARVGVGQSMYELAEYMSVNAVGTSVLLQALRDRSPSRLVVASSMSVYGEGRYLAGGRPIEVVGRTRSQLERRDWEPRGPNGESLEPAPTPEGSRPSLASIYALGKHAQERMCLIFGEAYDVPATALRIFNTYGPDQAVSNPYTGVLAIFAARLMNRRPPLILEDGRQRRDFVAVEDVARAVAAALESEAAVGLEINVGSGEGVPIGGVAARLARAMNVGGIEPEVTGRYRAGDVRHCFADISLAREVLGYEPRVDLDDGLAALAASLEGKIAIDRVDGATAELASRGLMT
jgi:dTDP-L-rhamnose 4-epimerase